MSRSPKKVPKGSERAKARGEKLSIRSDLKGRGDPGFGTSPSSLGQVKMQSEEARLVACPECGYGEGRHARSCQSGRG